MKITTADCKKKLDAELPDSYGKSSKGWTRKSKRGTAKTQIVRVFHHKELPVIGTVVEVDGHIDCSFAPMTKEKEFDGPVSNEHFSADQLYFAFREDQEDGYTRVAICQVSHFDKHRYLCSDVRGQTMKGLLPDGLEESSESFFETSMSEEQVSTALRARGFKESAAFTSFVESI